MFMRILGSILSKVGESFLTKMVEQTADNANNNVRSIKDFELNLKTLQKRLKSLSAKASDVGEEIKNAELSGRKKRKREVEEWLEEVESIKQEVVELGNQVESEGFIVRLMDGGKVAKLNNEVEKLVEQSRNFGELLIDVCGTRGETLLTNGMVGSAFDENLERILELLMSRAVSSIGVYGMGGVGKTTLAKHIHNRLLQQSHEGGVFWVTVSQEFTIRSLQDKIARFLGVDLFDEDEEDIRAATLHRVLSQMKNIVLILDDVWDGIDLLKVGCPISVDCCRLIITTRSLGLCRQIGCQKEIPVEKLREGEAWKLFKETLGIEKKLDPQVEEIAKAMAKLCAGLPLGIITVAGSMRGETLNYMWTHALVKLKEYVMGQYGMDGELEVFKVLKYSFDRLNRNHGSHKFNSFQLCFLYCSLYPEDDEIPREDLVRKFISDGLVDQRRSMRAQIDEGHSILHTLTSVCLLESCVDDFGRKCVKMHDLVRGMALKIRDGKYMVRAGEESLTEIPNEEKWTEGLEKVSLMKSGIRRIEDGISPNCPKLSTLLLWGNPLEVIPDSFFSRMKVLCTLDLCRTHITKLPDSISDMKSLKALLLESCHMLEYVPYLGMLKSLKELNLSKTNIMVPLGFDELLKLNLSKTNIMVPLGFEELLKLNLSKTNIMVPLGLEELLNLEFLSMDVPGLAMFPIGLLLRLQHLQHVNFPFQIPVPIKEIENLKELQGFCGRVRSVNDYNRFAGSCGWVHGTPCYTIGIGSSITSSYILGTRDFGCYKNELILYKCSLEDDKVLGQSIVYLTVIKCKGLSLCFVDNFSRSSNPTSLERLRIESCGGLECLLSNDEGSTPFQFSTLEHIRLVGLEDLKGVVIQKEEIGAAAPAHAIFSSLKRLKISKCNKMRMMGLPVPAIPNLKEITIDGCGEIQEIFEDNGRGSATTLPKLEKLKLQELPRLRKVGLLVLGAPNLEEITITECGEIEEIFEEDEGRAASLPKLTRLSLSDLPRLKSISKATILCNSIQDISIRKCPILMNKLPLHFGDPTLPPTLRSIEVEREWWESLQWDGPDLPQLHSILQFY